MFRILQSNPKEDSFVALLSQIVQREVFAQFLSVVGP